MSHPTPTVMSSRTAGLFLAAAVALAALLRLPCLSAELWFDEVWSWEFARTAETPWEVFAGPHHHHDNNHKLNTLYLYFVPDGLPFACYRLHSFVAGLAAVLLAFRAASRRGPLAGLFAALLVAANYWFVLCSAEARGYALVLAFALAAFDGLQRHLRGGGAWPLAQFWLAVILGFLAHLTFLHAYLALGVWTVYHFARSRTTTGNELRQLLRAHAIPAAFVAVLFLADVRGMEIGGGPSIPVAVVLGRLLCFGFGVPFTPALGVFVAALVLAVLLRGLQLLRRAGDDSWVFFAMATVGAPLMLLAIRPQFIYERYFFLPWLFFLVLLAYVLADLARRVPLGAVAAAALLVGTTAGHVLEVEAFVSGGGRGQFIEALRYLDAHSGDGEVTIASESDFRLPKMLAFYGRYANPRRHFVYLKADDAEERPADWLLIHELEAVRFPEEDAAPYRREAAFRVTAYGGWDWYVYRRVVVAP
jgi:hypothetical protein